MQSKSIPHFFILLLFSTSCFSLVAQRVQTISAGLGTAFYSGDLTKTYLESQLYPGIMLSYQTNFNSWLGVKADLSQIVLGANEGQQSDPVRRARNLSFRSPLTEFSLSLVADLNPDRYIGKRWITKPHITPYLFGGIAVFRFSPQAKYDNRWHNLQELGTEGQFIPNGDYAQPYSLFSLAIPVGAGVRLRWSQSWGASIEACYRNTFTDYLDDVSTEYPDQQLLLETVGPIAAALSNRTGDQVKPGAQRGNPGARDSYISIKIALNYFIFSRH